MADPGPDQGAAVPGIDCAIDAAARAMAEWQGEDYAGSSGPIQLGWRDRAAVAIRAWQEHQRQVAEETVPGLDLAAGWKRQTELANDRAALYRAQVRALTAERDQLRADLLADVATTSRAGHEVETRLRAELALALAENERMCTELDEARASVDRMFAVAQATQTLNERLKDERKNWRLSYGLPAATPVPVPTIPLDALRAMAQGEPLEDVVSDYGVPEDVVLDVAPLVGRSAYWTLSAPVRVPGDHDQPAPEPPVWDDAAPPESECWPVEDATCELSAAPSEAAPRAVYCCARPFGHTGAHRYEDDLDAEQR